MSHCVRDAASRYRWLRRMLSEFDKPFKSSALLGLLLHLGRGANFLRRAEAKTSCFIIVSLNKFIISLYLYICKKK